MWSFSCEYIKQGAADSRQRSGPTASCLLKGGGGGLISAHDDKIGVLRDATHGFGPGGILSVPRRLEDDIEMNVGE
jgi:hypothetical protein